MSLKAEIAAGIHKHIWGNEYPSDEADCCADETMKIIASHLTLEDPLVERAARALHESTFHPTPWPELPKWMVDAKKHEAHTALTGAFKSEY